jgi:hypothetical protein
MPSISHDKILKRTLSRPSGLATYISTALETKNPEYIRHAIRKVKELTGIDAVKAVRNLERAQGEFASLHLSMRVELEQDKKPRRALRPRARSLQT